MYCISKTAGPSPGLVQSPGADRVHHPGQTFTHPANDSSFISTVIIVQYSKWHSLVNK